MKGYLSVIWILLIVLTACAVNKGDIATDQPKNPVQEIIIEEPVEETPIDLIPMVMVDGKLYLDTGKASAADARCGVMDGEITSSVSSNQKPSKNDQSNFGSGYSYQYGPKEGCIELCLENGWFIFATEEAMKTLEFSDRPFQFLANGKEQAPYAHFLNSKQWTEDGWLCGDGKNLRDTLPVIEGSLSVLTDGEDMEYRLGEGAELLRISIWDQHREPVKEGKDLSIFSQVPEGSYFVGFAVQEQGAYIESEAEYETKTYSYIYKFVK